MIGIYLQSIYQVNTALLALVCVMFGTGLIVICWRKWHRVELIALNGLFLCIGALVLNLQQNHAEHMLAKIANQEQDIIATVVDRHIQPTTKPCWKQTEVLDLAITHPFSFKLQCSVKHTTKVEVGDTILIKKVTIKKTPHQTLSGNPSYGTYLLKEGFLASIFLWKNPDIKIINHPAWSIRRWWWNLRNNTFQNIMAQLSPRAASYYSLIFLGKKDPDSTQRLRRIFNFWGLAHYLARSGLHIVLFILMWKFILSFLPAHLIIKRILLVLICGTYGALSWASTPFIRAFFSFLLSEIGMLFNCSINFFHVLTLVCLLMLLFNPLQFFFLDFQLTFGLTFALSWFSGVNRSVNTGK